MRVSEQMIISVLHTAGSVRSFWRRSARLAGTPAPVVPEGLVLDMQLSYVDFAVAAKILACNDEWSQVIGGTDFGGAVRRLMTDTEAVHVARVQGNGERDEQ